MTPEVIIGAVVTALTTVVGLFYRELLRRAEAAEAEAAFWRDKALTSTGLAEIATDEVRKRSVRR